LPSVFPKWFDDWIANMGLDLALDLTADLTKAYTNPNVFEELQGISDASGVSYDTILRVHMIAGLTQGKCSMFGAWGSAVVPKGSTGYSGLLQLRALDWDMGGPFRDGSLVTVYHPSSPSFGHSFCLVGFFGFIGGLTGMSSSQLGISEIGVSYPDSSFGSESRIGVPFIFLLRDILNLDYTVDDAINRMINSKRTCDLILGVGDGKIEEFRGMEYSSSVLDVFDDDNMRPTNGTWHPLIEDVVYWGMDWMCPSYDTVLAQQLQQYHGKLTLDLSIQIASVVGSGDNHVAFYDLTNMNMLVSFAAPYYVAGPVNAYSRQFLNFNVTALFAETAPYYKI